VRRTVGYRLPRGSLVVDVAWRPGSALALFADDYPTIALAPGPDRRPAATAVVTAELRRLPLAEDSVDCALLVGVGDDVDGRRAALVEIRRILRPGGMAVLSAAPTVSDGGRRRDAGRITSALADAGLVPEEVHHLRSLLHPLSIASRARSRARSGVSATGRDRRSVPVPPLCRAVAALNHLDRAQAAHWFRAGPPAVLVLGRKP
jgi:SAM-dependent methyltransferase